MYQWSFILVLLWFAESSVCQESTPRCRENTPRYCRPSSPRKYTPPHSDYHTPGRSTVTVAPPDSNTVQTTATPAVDTFEGLAQNLVEAELAIRRYCLRNSLAVVREMYGSLYYELTYTLQGVQENEVLVRIRDRVIYVSIEKPGGTVFKDLRILPNVLIAGQASWVLQNGDLIIMIPYATLNSNESGKCQDVNDTLITVAKNPFSYQYDGTQSSQLNVGPNWGSGRTPQNVRTFEDALVYIFGSQDGSDMIDIRNNFE